MTLIQLEDTLGIHVPETWYGYWEAVCKEYKERIDKLCNEEKTRQLLHTYQFCLEQEDEILQAFAGIRENEALALFECMLDCAMRNDATRNCDHVDFPAGEGLEFRYVALPPMLHAVPEHVQHMRSRGVPEDVVRDTLKEFEACMYLHLVHDGAYAFTKRFYSWISMYIEDRLIRIGRLNYELRDFQGNVQVFTRADGKITMLADDVMIHRSGRFLNIRGCEDPEGAFHAKITETEEDYTGYPVDERGLVSNKPIILRKDTWQLRLQKGDPVYEVHIPRIGPMDQESCQESYARARELLGKCYPDHKAKAFAIESWLLDQELSQILPADSNIVKFQKQYIPYPIRATGTAALFFVFPHPTGTDYAKLDYSALPETTSLQRQVKKKFLAGAYMYEGGGIFF